MANDKPLLSVEDVIANITTPDFSEGKQPTLKVVGADEIQPEQIYYLWESRIPLGALTIMPGEEGIGKSTIAYRLIADLTNGKLEGEFLGQPQTVLVLAPEDSLASVVVPRLIAASADLTRVKFLPAKMDPVTGRELPDAICLPRDLELISDKVIELEAKFVYIDSLVNLFPADASDNNYKDVNRIIKPINETAEKLGIAFLAPWHLNKSNADSIAKLMMGSRGLRTAARSILIVYRNKEADVGVTEGYLSLDKSNGSSMNVPTLHYRIVNTHYRAGNGFEGWTGVAEWIGEVEGDGRQFAESQLLKQEGKEVKLNARDKWLKERLSSGETLRAEVVDEAVRNGMSEAAIKKSAQKLHVRSRLEGFGKEKAAYWSLPTGDSEQAPGELGNGLTGEGLLDL